MPALKFPFLEPADKGYCLFPDDWESNELIFFHGTSATAAKQIDIDGFKAPITLPSVSFSKTSALALKYGCEHRSEESPDGCVIAVQYDTLVGLDVGPSVVHDYRLKNDRTLQCGPKLIGYYCIPADYDFA